MQNEQTKKYESMKSIFLIFPHQLFKDISLLKLVEEVYLVEEYLFFNQYKFHKQKLVLHRASMKYYESYLQENNIKVNYIESTSSQNDIRVLLNDLKAESIEYYDVCDNWLEKRIRETCRKKNISTKEHSTPLFINTKQDLEVYFGTKQKYFQTDFYIQQRKKLHLLIDENGKPMGGKWSFDSENRLKYPKDKAVPQIVFPAINTFYNEAIEYVSKNYANNYGTISETFIYPTTHHQSELWLNQFF